MASQNVIELTDDQFDAAVGDSTPILVDFWAEWCAPCRQLAPTIDEIADEFSGRLKVAKLDIDQHRAAAEKHGIQSIPTLLIFKDGQVAEKITGRVPKDQIVEAINRVL